jgi:excisionase family DNA binding protein
VEPLTYTITEAMQVAKIGRTLLFERIAAGELPVTRIGRRTLIPADGLKAWLQSHTTEAPALKIRGRR